MISATTSTTSTYKTILTTTAIVSTTTPSTFPLASLGLSTYYNFNNNLQETKIGPDIPNSLLDTVGYSMLRRDRVAGSGGLLIYFKSHHKLMHSKIDSCFETITLTLLVNHQRVQFISSYNPHLEFSTLHLNNLGNIMKTLEVCPTVIIGDLNQDLLTSRGDKLREFMLNFNFRNAISLPTHFQRGAATSIDVLLSNDVNLVRNSATIACPFSNHSFITGILSLDNKTSGGSTLEARMLSKKNLDLIKTSLASVRFDLVDLAETVEDKWAILKKLLLDAVDKHAPIKRFRLKKKQNLPWVDKECLYFMHKRDRLHSIAVKLKSPRGSQLWADFKTARNRVKSLLRRKMTKFFADKHGSYFKSTKAYWSLYRTVVKTKKDSTSSAQSVRLPTGLIVSDEVSVANEFNTHFAEIGKGLDFNEQESADYINHRFTEMKRTGWLKVDSTFELASVLPGEVRVLLKQLDPSSSAGVSNIPVKFLMHCADVLDPVLMRFFNSCIAVGAMPNEWKRAIVSPLFKGKGDRENMDSYRGISVLTPLSKCFERILSSRLISYINANNLLCEQQHGFRSNRSCETALITAIEHWKSSLAKNKYVLALFIDFKKAFDLLNRKLLFLKLFHYGFDNSSLKLFTNYFNTRSQTTKINKTLSSTCDICLGVPQGSVLGPLLFLLFINDLAFDTELNPCLFADDTTVSSSGSDVNSLISAFNSKFVVLAEWVNHNQLVVNWDKTKCMFLSSRYNICNLDRIVISCHSIEVVSEFKLLGVIIDKHLSFNAHVNDVKIRVNTRLYSIKKIYFLSERVKIQFFKTFILPIFDYCSSLFVYFSKTLLCSLDNFFSVCLARLLNLDIKHLDVKDQFVLLSKFNLLPFRIRLFHRVSNLCFKIMNKHSLEFLHCTNLDIGGRLRNSNIVMRPKVNSVFSSLSFNVFIPNLINKCLRNCFKLPLKEFLSCIRQNTLIFYTSFEKLVG
jgi:Reverse transcriptase (RNA-dependent DNA polymerase)